MDGVILLIIIVAFIIDIVAALQFRDIAELKGHDGSPYFWFCLFLAMAGWAMIIALPDLHARPSAQPAAPANSGKTDEVVSDELPDL